MSDKRAFRDMEVRIHSRIEIVENSLRIDVADPHQSERCAEDHRRHPVLMNDKRLSRRKFCTAKLIASDTG